MDRPTSQRRTTRTRLGAASSNLRDADGSLEHARQRHTVADDLAAALHERAIDLDELNASRLLGHVGVGGRRGGHERRAIGQRRADRVPR